MKSEGTVVKIAPPHGPGIKHTWIRHDMETLSAILSIYEGNQPVIDGFPVQIASNAGLYILFDVSFNKLLSRLSICRRFMTPWRSCDVTVKVNIASSCEVSDKHCKRYKSLRHPFPFYVLYFVFISARWSGLSVFVCLSATGPMTEIRALMTDPLGLLPDT